MGLFLPRPPAPTRKCVVCLCRAACGWMFRLSVLRCLCEATAAIIMGSLIVYNHMGCRHHGLVICLPIIWAADIMGSLFVYQSSWAANIMGSLLVYQSPPHTIETPCTSIKSGVSFT